MGLGNIRPISVCLAFGFSSAYWHICLRSRSVKVLRGVGVCLAEPVDEVADTGVEMGAIGTGVGWYIGGT